MAKARRIMKEFSIMEISGVDRPAQAHARTVIFKRADSKETDAMTPEEKAKMDQLVAEADKSAKRLAELEATAKKSADDATLFKALAEMTDDQKAHYGKQDDAGKASFLKMTPEQRGAAVAVVAKAAAEANPVVYTATDGTVYRKSDDSRLAAMAKKMDEDAKKHAEALEKSETMEFAKRADAELSHLPGDVDKVKVPLLRAISKMGAEAQAGAEALLKAADSTMAKAFNNIGLGGLPVNKEVGDANAQLKKMAEEHAKAASVSFAKAYATVIDTPEGRKLYEQTLNPRARAA